LTCVPDDVFWCTADIGWITGHTYVAYGPLAAGATQIIFEGIPHLPECRPLLADDRAPQVHHFLHRSHGHPLAHQGSRSDEKVHPARSDLSSLRILGSVGEPINPEAWMWYYKNVGGERAPSWTPSGRPKPAAT
jgi:acetyl-CoA synthetase